MSYSYDTSHNSPNFTPGRDAKAVFGYDRVIEGFTVHWWGDPSTNPSFNGVRDYLSRANGNTSAHIVATGTGRQVACIVDFNDVAWHSGSAWGNARTIGIELDPRAREEDKDVFAEVLADLRSAFGNLPLYWHNYFIQTTCPGVYTALVDDLDQRSYRKISGAQWGQVTNKDTSPTPTPAPVPPVVETPTTTPSPVLYKLLDVKGKQLAAYSTEANAYKGYVQYGKVGKILLGKDDVTALLVTKYTEPSPTATPPAQGGGLPVAEKPDYSEENNTLLKQILSIVTAILNKLTGVFK